jgi:hypothetical protein
MERRYLQCRGESQTSWQTIAIVNETNANDEVEHYKRDIPSLLWRHVDASQIENRVDAEWSISLDLECPYCNEQINLLDGEWPEGIQAGEHGTEQTKGYEVECPGCDRTLLADFVF